MKQWKLFKKIFIIQKIKQTKYAVLIRTTKKFIFVFLLFRSRVAHVTRHYKQLSDTHLVCFFIYIYMSRPPPRVRQKKSLVGSDSGKCEPRWWWTDARDSTSASVKVATRCSPERSASNSSSLRNCFCLLRSNRRKKNWKPWLMTVFLCYLAIFYFFVTAIVAGDCFPSCEPK